jgi:rhodanese-related sulfurtransferase
LAEANRAIETIPVAEARRLHGRDDVLFVDLRDVRELERDGMIPGAFHAPRGMLEFWIDPESPYHKPVFAEPKRFLFYCASGWRSALAAKTAAEMGLGSVCHLEGGFSAWKKDGGPVAEKPSRPAAG